MKLIIDSGSTKSDLVWINDNTTPFSCQASGINPFYQSEEDITNSLSNCCSDLYKLSTSEIFFYGAGCAFPDKCEIVRSALHSLFPSAIIEVHSDLLGAARSLLQNEAGVACILGTGSNSCAYDGKKIIQNVAPLGFILGDEGSGAVIGKRFIGDLLKGDFPGGVPSDLKKEFFKSYQLSSQSIMNATYKEKFPNRFLANFTHFIHRYKDTTYCQNLLHACFYDFYQRNLSQYNLAPYNESKICFTGSVAFFFQKEIRDCLKNFNRSIGIIEKSPLNGLIKFHSL